MKMMDSVNHLINKLTSRVLLSVGVMATAMVGHAQTLEQTMVAAQNYQTSLKQADLATQLQAQHLNQVNAQYGLSVGAMAQLGLGEVGVETGAMFPTEGKRIPKNFGLSASYPLYTGGRKTSALTVAQAELTNSQQQQQQAYQQVSLQALIAHLNVLEKQDLLGLVQANQASLDKAVSDARKRLKAGVVTKTDLAQAQAGQAEGVANIAAVQAALAVANNHYQHITGEVPTNLQRVTLADITLNHMRSRYHQELDVASVDLSQLLTWQASDFNEPNPALPMLVNNPNLRAAQAAVATATAKRSQANHLLSPSVQLTAHATSQDDSDMSTYRLTSTGVMLEAKLPLFDAGASKAAKTQANLAIALAHEQVRQVQLQLTEQLRNLAIEQHSLIAQQRALAVAEKAAVLSLNTIKRELALGTRTTYDLLVAQQQLNSLYSKQIQNDNAKKINRARVLALMGML